MIILALSVLLSIVSVFAARLDPVRSWVGGTEYVLNNGQRKHANDIFGDTVPGSEKFVYVLKIKKEWAESYGGDGYWKESIEAVVSKISENWGNFQSGGFNGSFAKDSSIIITYTNRGLQAGQAVDQLVQWRVPMYTFDESFARKRGARLIGSSNVSQMIRG